MASCGVVEGCEGVAFYRPAAAHGRAAWTVSMATLLGVLSSREGSGVQCRVQGVERARAGGTERGGTGLGFTACAGVRPRLRAAQGTPWVAVGRARVARGGVRADPSSGEAGTLLVRGNGAARQVGARTGSDTVAGTVRRGVSPPEHAQ